MISLLNKEEPDIAVFLEATSPHVDLSGDYRGVITSDINIAEQELVFIATHAYPQLYYGIEGFQIRNDQLLEGIRLI